jgi:uncharacterized protein (DUF983 family)
MALQIQPMAPRLFSMMVMAFPITGFALWLDMKYEPPFWVHLVTSLPLLLLLSILPLRPLKGWLVCSQFYHKAEEGRLAPSQQIKKEGD